MKNALIIVDPQLDFMPGGSLAIPKGDEIVHYINKIKLFFWYDVVVVTRDWHPADHKCFTTNNGKNVLDTVEVDGKSMIVWPPHCVQNEKGSEFHPDLNLSGAVVFSKGFVNDDHPFSGFAGEIGGIMSLSTFLISQDITDVDVMGLAGDYCVKDTALDSVKYFNTRFVLKGIRFLGDPSQTIDILKDAGVEVVDDVRV